MQPIHRVFHWKNRAVVRVDGYKPRLLGKTPKEAADGLLARLQGLVATTEHRVGMLLEKAGMPMAEVKRLCGTELMPIGPILAVAKVRAERAEEWDAVIRETAMECVHVSADALHTALAFAPNPIPEAKLNATGVNLVFNPSFEEAGDGVPLGWCVGWLDLKDRAGRAGVRRHALGQTGEDCQRSALVLWAPKS